MKKLMAAMLSFVMAMMLLAGCASASTDKTFSDPMQQVSLSNDEMLASRCILQWFATIDCLS